MGFTANTSCSLWNKKVGFKQPSPILIPITSTCPVFTNSMVWRIPLCFWEWSIHKKVVSFCLCSSWFCSFASCLFLNQKISSIHWSVPWIAHSHFSNFCFLMGLRCEWYKNQIIIICVNEMAQKNKMLAIKSEDLSSILRLHTVGEKQPLQAVLWPPHVCCRTYEHAH